MADTRSRMLELLSLLQLHRYWHGADLADRLGISHRTLRRDIDRLRVLGYTIDSLRGVDGGYQMAAGANLPPMVFTHDEAVALAVGLRDVAHGSDQVTAEASLRALAKLTATLPPAVRRQVELMQHVTDGAGVGAWSSQDQPAAHVLGAVAQACQDVVRLRFGYRGYGAERSEARAESGGRTDRYVEPYRLVTRGRRWYLVAFDLDRNDWRTFRVDRMSDPVATRNPFTARQLPAEDLARYVADRIRDLRPRHDVEFTVHAPEPAVRAMLGRSVSELTRLSARRTRVALTVDDLDWAMHTILAIDAHVTVNTPELLAHLTQRCAALRQIVTAPTPAE